ncbi:MAG: glycosyltransferase family 4 protein [Candidatus Omnitrophica bacterium]|nr:glycosyltransferase family 4 protein [Candidatus Omnitrophota bacterium]
MKILFISYNGALEPIMSSQGLPYFERLSKEGDFQISLLSFEKDIYLKNKEMKLKLSKELRDNKITWYQLKYHKKPKIISTVFDVFYGLFYTLSLVKKQRIIIVHARSYVPAMITCLVKKCLKIKFIFDMRGMMIDEYAEGGIFKRGGFIYKIGKKIEKILLVSSDAIVVLTEAIGNEIKNKMILNPGTKVTVIPCCVNLVQFSFKKDITKETLGLGKKTVFVYSGSIGTWYNFEGLIDFFKTVHNQLPQAHLLVLSHAPAEDIKKIAADKGVNLDNVTIERVEHDRMPLYLSCSDVGLAFYKKGYSRMACSPVKLAEYLACGLPVIINSGVGDTRSIIEKNKVGVILEEFTPKGYEQAFKAFSELSNEGDGLRRRCRNTAETFFSIDNAINKYREIYLELGMS